MDFLSSVIHPLLESKQPDYSGRLRDPDIFDDPAILRRRDHPPPYRRTIRSAAALEGLTLAADLVTPVGVPRLSIPSRPNGHRVISSMTFAMLSAYS
jgi:hypothetical protein